MGFTSVVTFVEGEMVAFALKRKQGNEQQVQVVLRYIIEIWSKVLQSNRKNRERQKCFWNVIVLQEKSQSGLKKLICKQES